MRIPVKQRKRDHLQLLAILFVSWILTVAVTGGITVNIYLAWGKPGMAAICAATLIAAGVFGAHKAWKEFRYIRRDYAEDAKWEKALGLSA